MLWCVVLVPGAHADIYAEIDDHINNNRLSEARGLIQTALVDNGGNPKLHLQLSAISEYQGDHQGAIQTLRSGLGATGASHDLFYYNIGNNYFALRRYTDAEQAYSQAIQSNSAYEPSYINRANSRVWQEKYVDAIEDYTHYLAIAPQGEHRSEVKRMIAVLRGLLNAEEARERERLARERRLLDEALGILQDSRNEGRNSRAPSAAIDELDAEIGYCRLMRLEIIVSYQGLRI